MVSLLTQAGMPEAGRGHYPLTEVVPWLRDHARAAGFKEAQREFHRNLRARRRHAALDEARAANMRARTALIEQQLRRR